MRVKAVKRIVVCVIMAAVVLNAAGCGTYKSSSIKAQELTAEAVTGDATGDEKRPIGGSGANVELDDAFVGGAADFAIGLFKRSVSKEGNSMVSPLSVLLALAMTANGADGETLVQMEQMLCDGISIDKLNEYCKAYVDALPATRKAQLSIANSIWIRDDFDVKKDFLVTDSVYYDASVYKAAFDGQTVNDINVWVSDKTKKMIDRIIDKLDENTVMCLINAVAFDAEWQSIYEDTSVRDGVFTTEDGSTQNVTMMHSSEHGYIKDEKATGFVKEYRDGYSFVALLPNEGVPLDEYIASLDGESFIRMLKGKKDAVVHATLPKFESEYEIELNDVLSDMGMSDAFVDGKADFSGMSDSKLHIGMVKHKTFIKVDERGTKAGAVTVVMANGTGVMTEDIYEVNLDRPFVYAIVDDGTNLPIFIGAVRSVDLE